MSLDLVQPHDEPKFAETNVWTLHLTLFNLCGRATVCVFVFTVVELQFFYENHGYKWLGFSDDEMPRLFISSKHEIRLHKLNHAFLSVRRFALIFNAAASTNYSGRFNFCHFCRSI